MRYCSNANVGLGGDAGLGARGGGGRGGGGFVGGGRGGFGRGGFVGRGFSNWGWNNWGWNNWPQYYYYPQYYPQYYQQTLCAPGYQAQFINDSQYVCRIPQLAYPTYPATIGYPTAAVVTTPIIGGTRVVTAATAVNPVSTNPRARPATAAVQLTQPVMTLTSGTS